MTRIPIEDAEPGDRRLRRIAQDALKAGQVPDAPAAKLWGGPCDGAACSVCQKPISPPVIGYELEFSNGDGGPTIHFLHIPCYAAWEAERTAADDTTTQANGRLNGHARDLNGSGGPDGSHGSEDPR